MSSLPRRKKYQQKLKNKLNLEQSFQNLSKQYKKQGLTQPSTTFQHLAQSSDIIINQQINPKRQAIITENVPFLAKAKLSYWYIGINTILLIFYLIFIIIVSNSNVSDLCKIMIGCVCGTLYMVYVIAIIKYSNIWQIKSMQSIQQFQKYFYFLVNAKTYFKFTIFGSKTTGLQKDNIKQMILQPNLIDKSGKLYQVDNDTELLMIHFHKKYYFGSQKAKQKLIKKYDHFTDENQQLLNNTNKSTKAKQRVEYIIQGFSYHKCFYKDQNVSKTVKLLYLGLFFISFVLGFAIIYEYWIQRKVLRVDIDITKQITTKLHQLKQ